MLIIGCFLYFVITLYCGYLLGKTANSVNINTPFYGKKDVLSYCQCENKKHGWEIKDYFTAWAGKRIAIYGKSGFATQDLLTECGKERFVCMIDSVCSETDENELPLISPKEIFTWDIDIIIIASLAHGEAIRDSLLNSGYSGKIYTYFELVYCLKIIKQKLPVRVAIATWAGYHSLNYGSYFQNMALQIELKKLGCQSVTMVVDGCDKNRLQRFKKYFRIPKYIRTCFKFRLFAQKKVHFGKALLNYRDAIEDVIKYRCTILLSGADAIWPCRYINDCFVWNFDELSDFPKASYAASISNGNPFYPERGAAIAKFFSISVREKATIPQMCFDTENDEAIRKNVVVSLDPVLLAHTFFYSECNIPKRIIKESYILCYLFGPPRNYEIIKEIQTRHNAATVKYIDMNMIDCFYDGKRKRNYDYSKNSISCVGPSQFLSLIKYASAVVTDSYHGTLFSVIFHKQVYNFKKLLTLEALPVKTLDPRMQEVYDKLHLGNRWVTSIQCLKEISDINYEEVDKALEKEQEDSLLYLKSIIEKGKMKWMDGMIFDKTEVNT